MQKKKNEGEVLYGELGEAFNFTYGDLEANRAGFISHRQAQALRGKTVDSIFAMQVMTVFFLALTIVFGISAFTADMVMLCFAAPFALFTIIFVALSIDRYWSMYQDVTQRVIKDERFELRQLKHSDGSFEYWLQNEKRGFKITAAQWATLKSKPYQVYYAERSVEIVSIEDAE